MQFEQLFDRSVGMTGEAELAELDGPFIKISLRGRFWHERSLVLARLGNYLKQRIPVSFLSIVFVVCFVEASGSCIPGNLGGGYRRWETIG